jgi:hypothetical protein
MERGKIDTPNTYRLDCSFTWIGTGTGTSNCKTYFRRRIYFSYDQDDVLQKENLFLL